MRHDPLLHGAPGGSRGAKDKGGLAISFTSPPTHSLAWVRLRSSDLY
ncbi:hypothetical protein ACFXPX_00165 [Kitasatospora sp. NPDC059146]